MNGQITVSDYVDIVCNQVHPVVQILFPYIAAVFQDDNLNTHTHTQKCSVLVGAA
jgi:hypothetical protein